MRSRHHTLAANPPLVGATSQKPLDYHVENRRWRPRPQRSGSELADRRRLSSSRGCWTRRHPRTIYCPKRQPFVEPTKMPWTADDAERHTHKATTWALKELWAKSPMNAWSEPAMKAARSGKRTPWSRGRQHPANNQIPRRRSLRPPYTFPPSILQGLPPLCRHRTSRRCHA